MAYGIGAAGLLEAAVDTLDARLNFFFQKAAGREAVRSHKEVCHPAASGSLVGMAYKADGVSGQRALIRFFWTNSFGTATGLRNPKQL